METNFNYHSTYSREQRLEGLSVLAMPDYLRPSADYVPCPKCEGRGCWRASPNATMHCEICHGQGYVHRGRTDFCEHVWVSAVQRQSWEHPVVRVGYPSTERMRCTECGVHRTLHS